MASLEARTKRGPWRVVWRDGGRGSKKHHTEWYPRKGTAEGHKERLEEAQAAKAPIVPGSLVPWAKLVGRFVASRGDTTEQHRSDSRSTLERLAEARGWQSTAEVTPANTIDLKVYQRRVLRAFLAWAVDMDQPVDVRVLRKRPKKQRTAPLDLLTDRHAALLQRWADRTSPGNGAIVHCMLTYGHRAESLIPLTCGALAGETLNLKVKSGDEHAHSVARQTLEILQGLIAGRGKADPLFLNHLGEQWQSGRDFAAWWHHQLPRMLRLPSRTRPTGRVPGVLTMRRYGGTRLLDLGVDLKTAAAVQGRKTASLLADVYALTNLARKSAAVDALEKKLDSLVSPGVPSD